jgi:DNA-binding SARP family transcriptional activator
MDGGGGLASASSPAALHFAILGPLEITRGGRPLSVAGAKLQSLLAILLVRANEVVSTDRLIEDLWDEMPPPNATATLHSYVSQLRSALGPGAPNELITRRPGYVLRVGAEQLDATCFESQVAIGRRAVTEGDTATAVAAFGGAVALWRGPALTEFADHEFARGEITRLAELRAQAIEDLVDARLRVGEATELIPELEQLVHEEPLRERRWAQLMLALYRANRQAEALRAYQHLRQVLGDELGIEPSSDLAQLEEDILLQRPELRAERVEEHPARDVPVLAQSASEEPGVPFVPTAPIVLVDRADELQRLRHLFQDLKPSQRRFVLVSGEAGIGKTALLATFAHEVATAGAVVLYGRSDEEALIPYQPFLEALSDVGYARGDSLTGSDPDESQQVARHVPAARRLLELADTAPADPESERYQWFETVNAELEVLASDRAVVLCLDDLQWSDWPTLRLIRHVLRRRGRGRMLLVGLVRDLAAGSHEALDELIGDLRREEVLERVSLSGLSEEGVAELVTTEAPVALGPAGRGLVRAIARQTSGNPFFVLELTRNLREAGELAGTDAPVARGALSLDVPLSVRDVVAGRIARLSPASREVLTLAAALGAEFDSHVLGQIASAPVPALFTALDEAERTRLVLPVESAERYRFSHSIVRDAVYAGLSAARRQALHAEITHVLEGLNATRSDEYLSDLAYHACSAVPVVDPRTAVDYARRAADQATSGVAFEVAARHYDRALDVLRRASIADGLLQCQLLLALGEAHNHAGDIALGKRALLSAAEHARSLARPDLLARAALAYGGSIPGTPLVEDPETLQLLEEALDALGETDSPLRALALARLAHWLHRRGDLDELRQKADEAIAIARRNDDPATLAEVLHSRYWALYGPDDVDERLEVAGEICSLGERLSDPELVLQGTQCRVQALLELGDVTALRPAARRRTELATALRHPHYLWNAETYDTMLAATEGRLEEAETAALRSLATRRQNDPVSAITVYVVQMHQIRWLQHRMSELVGMLQELVGREPGRASWLIGLAWAQVESGDLTAGAEQLDRVAAHEFDGISRGFEWLATAAGIAIVCRRLDDAERAERFYPLLLPYRGHICTAGQSAFFGSAEHHLGLLAATAGRRDEAIAHLDRAEEHHLEFGAVPFVQMSQSERASLQ